MAARASGGDRKGDLSMANSAVLSGVHRSHSHWVVALLHLEDRRMAIGAAQPLSVALVREHHFHRRLSLWHHFDVQTEGRLILRIFFDARSWGYRFLIQSAY